VHFVKCIIVLNCLPLQCNIPNRNLLQASFEPLPPPDFTLSGSFLFSLQIAIYTHSQRVGITFRKFCSGTALDIVYFLTLSAYNTHSRSSQLSMLANLPNYLSTIIRELRGEFCIYHECIFTKILQSDIKDNCSEC